MKVALYALYETINYPQGEIISTHKDVVNAHRALRKSAEPKDHLAVGVCLHGEKQGDQLGRLRACETSEEDNADGRELARQSRVKRGVALRYEY